MSISLNKLRTKVAAKSNSAFEFNTQHLTTLDFGLNRIAFCQELVPKDKISLDVSAFSRLAPLALPTIGDANMEVRAFFVRNRLLFDSWKEFLTNKTPYVDSDGKSVIPAVPRCNLRSLMTAFVALRDFSSETADCVLCEPVVDGEYDFDFHEYSFSDSFISNSPSLLLSSSIFRYRFTPLGKSVYAILSQLGYRLDFGLCYSSVSDSDGASTDIALLDEEVSLLPLYAYLKVYLDYYYNTRYDTSTYDSLFKGNGKSLSIPFKYSGGILFDMTANDYYSVNYVNNPFSLLYLLARSVYVLVSPDIYNSSWFEPFANNRNVANYYDLTTPTNGVVERTDSDVNSNTLDNWALRAMRSLESFARRNNIIGSRYVDQLLARFGVRPSDAVSGRSEYLGSGVIPIEIGDVTATSNGTTADGVTSEVGDYNGKGVAYGSTPHFEYETDEHGFFFVFCTVRPRTQYCEGASPSVYRTEVLDFFTPEFDAMGMELIPKLSMLPNRLKNSTTFYALQLGNQGFGYVPTYTDYKYKKDALSGDFVIPSLATGIEGFHLMRQFDSTVFPNEVKNDFNFSVFGPELRQQYDRIFRDTSIDVEHFFVSFVFKCKMYRPMMPIADTLQMPGEKGKEVTSTPGGQRF